MSPVPPLNENGERQLKEGVRNWAEEDFPLNEDLTEAWGSVCDLIDDEILGDNNLGDLFDDRVDSSLIEAIIREQEIANGMFNLGEQVTFLEDMEIPFTSSPDAGLSSIDSSSSRDTSTSPSVDEEPTSNCVQVQTPEVVEDSPLVIESASPSSSLTIPSVSCVYDQEIPSTSSPKPSSNDVMGQIILVESIDGEMMVEVPVDSQEMISTSTNTDSLSESPLNDSKSSRGSVKKSSLKSRRSTPYSRRKKVCNVESSSSSDEQDDYVMVGGRKERKRDQNRTAASRYRAKKRAEQDVLLAEEEVLLAKNKELAQKANQLSTEIGYLKDLMREMLISKGLLKK